MWIWIPVGVGSFLLLSLSVGLIVARISRAITEASKILYETDTSCMMPQARSTLTGRNH
jgi:hypothetical protein